MRLGTAILWTVLPIVAGAGLYLLKMQVEAQEERLTSLQRQIVEARESIHVLDAEWSYLNDPARLRDEAQRLLGMQPLKPAQIAGFDRMPFPDQPATPNLSALPLGEGSQPAPARRAAATKGAADAKQVAQADPIAAAIAALADPPRRKHP